MTIPTAEIRSLITAIEITRAAMGTNITTNLVARAFMQIDLDESECDGLPTSSRQDGMPHGGRSPDTSVERAAMAKYELRLGREDLRDAVISATAELTALLAMALMLAPKPTDAHARCEGLQAVGCGNVASDHHDALGSTHSGLCDDCWGRACRTCHGKAGENRLQGNCEACYRRAHRAAQAEQVMA